jgi:hypothetical protein
MHMNKKIDTRARRDAYEEEKKSVTLETLKCASRAVRYSMLPIADQNHQMHA